MTAKLTYHERAHVAARARWGPPRIVRLDSLTPDQRRLVMALIDAAKERTSAASDAPAEAQEADGAARQTPSAA